MNDMTDLERLVEIAAIKHMKARRDYALDTKDWATYAALHANHHYSHNYGEERREGGKANAEWVAAQLNDKITVHHSHSPVIELTSRTTATATWGMEDNIFWIKEDGSEGWLQGFGFYHETYEKIDGQWLFTSRSLKRQKIVIDQKPQVLNG